MSLPRHLPVAVSPGRVQMTTCFYMGQQLEHRISHQSALPRWWHPVWSFVTCCPEGFQCIAEHQLCWASSSLLWCNGLPAFYIYILLSSLDSQEIHLENLVHICPHARGQFSWIIQLLSSFPFQHGRYLGPIALWGVSVRIWCDSFWKDQLKIF